MQAVAKVCKTCRKSQIKNIDNMLLRVCKEQDRTVNGFESCNNFQRQCTLCEFEKTDCDERCELCLNLGDKPYFEARVVDINERY